MGSTSNLHPKPLFDGVDPGVFNTTDLQLLDCALAKAWDLLWLQNSALTLSQSEVSTRTILSKAITHLASNGERNIERLADYAVTVAKYKAG